MTAVRQEQEAAESLRLLFAARAGEGPAVEDLAGVALVRARRTSRRRATIGVLALAMTFVLGLGGTIAWRNATATQRPVEPVSGAAAPIRFDGTMQQGPLDVGTAPLKVDIVDGDRLYDATAGKWRELGLSGADATVVRTSLGWVAGGGTTVQLLRTDGRTIPLADAVDGWAVNVDGTEIAVTRGATIQLGLLGREGLQPIASSTLPAGYAPIGFLSTAVLVASADRSRYGVWWRDGRFELATGVTQLYESFQSDSFGLVHGSTGRPCLVQVSVGSGSLHKEAAAGCHEILDGAARRTATSRNGRNLAAAFDGGLWIINLDRSLTAAAINAAAPPAWIASCASDPDATPVWQDESTVLTTSRGRVIACGVDGYQRIVDLPDGVPATGALVPIRR
ncbi:MAG: hypothetical protein HOV79_08770 [Hamadaea sp.]|nr:hypothetical protein [Hamadaea sp.]